MAFPRAQNSRVQDLFLLAKNHYHPHAGPYAWDNSKKRDRAEDARRIVGFHNLYDIDRMSWHDAAWVVASDLLPILLTRSLADPGRLVKFMVDLGPAPFKLYPEPHPAGYYADMIEALMSEFCNTQVQERIDKSLPHEDPYYPDNYRWLMPFPRCTVDPFVFKLLRSETPRAVQLPEEP